MKNYFTKLLLLLLVVLLGTATYGCSSVNKPSFPLDAVEIQQSIDKYGLDWVVEEEINQTHEFSSEGFGKVFRLSKDGKSLGVITSIEKEDIRLLTVNLIGKAMPKSEEADDLGVEEKKENWDKVLQMMSDLYGDINHSEEAYTNMMSQYEADKNNEDNYIQYNEQFGNVYYNVFFTKNITVQNSIDGEPVGSEVIHYENNAAISIGNEGGNEFFLTGIEKYKN